MSLCSMHHARIKAGIFSQKMDQIASNTMDNFVEKAPCVILQPDSNYSTVHYIKGEISSLFLTVYIAHLKQDDIYHITVLKDNVKIGQVPLFLTIPLFEQPNGELRYHIKSKQRHEIYVRSHDGREKTIIFKLPEYFAAQVFTKKVSSILTYLKKKKIITEFRVFEEESSKRKYSECEPDTSEILMLAPPSPCTITMATTGINGGTNNSFLQQKHSLEELQEIVKLLSAAIEVGDVEHAKTLTGSLAAARAKVKIDIESADRIFGDTFPLTVQIEDRQGHSTVKLQVTASDTIRDLKNKFLFKYQFPVEVQRWVVGKKLPPDNETLSQHKIRGPGNTAYVYLVTAKSAMSEPTYQHQQSSSSSQRSLSSGSAYMNMSLPQQSQQSIRPSGQPGSFVRGSSTENPYTNMQNTSNLRASNSQASINDGGYEIFEPLDNSPQAAAVPVFAATVPAAPAAHAPISTSTPVGAVRKTSEEKKKTVGWECPACTYINMPTRPGCEICSTTKPDTYEMPDNYVLTAEELQRIQEEEDIERHMREGDESMRERIDTSQPLSERELDLILKFNDAIQNHMELATETLESSDDLEDDYHIITPASVPSKPNSNTDS